MKSAALLLVWQRLDLFNKQPKRNTGRFSDKNHGFKPTRRFVKINDKNKNMDLRRLKGVELEEKGENLMIIF